jgi:hypothetical protein
MLAFKFRKKEGKKIQRQKAIIIKRQRSKAKKKKNCD